MLKYRYIVIVVAIFALFGVEKTYAGQVVDLQNDDVHVLMVYDGNENNYHPRLQELDLILHHFTSNVKWKQINQLENIDVEQATHIIFVQLTAKSFPKDKTKLIEDHHKPVILIGEDATAFTTIPVRQLDDRFVYTEIEATNSQLSVHTRYLQEVQQIEVTNTYDVLLYGHNENSKQPIFIQFPNERYFLHIPINKEEMNRVLRNFFIEQLHEIIPNNHPSKQLAQIRLEEINPTSDPQPILEIGQYLDERNIPYQLVVTPVAYNIDTNTYHYLSDNEALVVVLTQLQTTNGTIVANGYLYTYSKSGMKIQNGFWDHEHNQIVTTDFLEKSVPLKKRENFANEAAYASYMGEMQSNEEQYIHSRLEKSIYEFAYADLYPVAFEAPNYGMSLNGYRILSHYYEAVVGRIQTENDGRRMTNMPVITSANFLYDMTYYPETIGYYDANNPTTISDMKQRIKEIQIIRDGVYGSFYHPYLGFDAFEQFFSMYESLENITWIDMQEDTLQVKAAYASWDVHEDRQFVVEVDKKTIRSIIRDNARNVTEYILWGIIIVVSIFVLLFLSIAIYLRLTLRKKLFDERKQ